MIDHEGDVRQQLRQAYRAYCAAMRAHKWDDARYWARSVGRWLSLRIDIVMGKELGR